MRELRQHASKYLQRVAAGESITVTDRGEPVAVLIPLLRKELRSELEALVAYDKRLIAAAEQHGLLVVAPGA